MRRWFIISFFVATHAIAQSMVSKVILLHYLDSSECISLIQPFISANEIVSGSGQSLVLHVTPQTLAKIRMLVHQIDVPAKTFKIAVYQGPADWLNQQKKQETYSTNLQINNPASQWVQVMNGQKALISMDKQVPIIKAVGFAFFPGVIYQQHRVQTGLLVQPILKGSLVQLTISRTRQQQAIQGYQQFDQQQLDTTVLIPLGQWVAIGAATNSSEESTSGVLYTTKNAFLQQSTLYIKAILVR